MSTEGGEWGSGAGKVNSIPLKHWFLKCTRLKPNLFKKDAFSFIFQSRGFIDKGMSVIQEQLISFIGLLVIVLSTYQVDVDPDY